MNGNTPAIAAMERSLQEALDEVTRELQVRERCYPRWTQEGRMSKTEATDRMERLKAAARYLEEKLAADEAFAGIEKA